MSTPAGTAPKTEPARKSGLAPDGHQIGQVAAMGCNGPTGPCVHPDGVGHGGDHVPEVDRTTALDGRGGPRQKNPVRRPDLRGLPALLPDRGFITEPEVAEIVRAYRRGVSLVQIAKTLGKTDSGLRVIIGSWTLRNFVLPAEAEDR